MAFRIDMVPFVIVVYHNAMFYQNPIKEFVENDLRTLSEECNDP